MQKKMTEKDCQRWHDITMTSRVGTVVDTCIFCMIENCLWGHDDHKMPTNKRESANNENSC